MYCSIWWTLVNQYSDYDFENHYYIPTPEAKWKVDVQGFIISLTSLYGINRILYENVCEVHPAHKDPSCLVFWFWKEINTLNKINQKMVKQKLKQTSTTNTFF